MVVDRHPAADPAVRGMQRAQPRQFARAAHPLTQPVQPQRQQNPGVGRVAPCTPLARLDRLLETPQRQPFQHPPNGPCRMLRFESPSRSVGCRISCLRLASRSRTASSITAPPPLHLPPFSSLFHLPFAIPDIKKITNSENDRQGSCRRAGVIFRNGNLKEVALEKCG